MSNEFSTPDFPCLPKFTFVLPNINLTVNVPKPYVGVSVNIDLACPFETAAMVKFTVGVEVVAPIPSVSLSIGP